MALTNLSSGTQRILINFSDHLLSFEINLDGSGVTDVQAFLDEVDSFVQGVVNNVDGALCNPHSGGVAQVQLFGGAGGGSNYTGV